MGVEVFFFDWVGGDLSEGVAFLVVDEAILPTFSFAVFSLAGCICVDSFLAGVALSGVDAAAFWAGASLTEAFAGGADLPGALCLDTSLTGIILGFMAELTGFCAAL